jgi:O-antigen/teichoic acid export membrane protein
MSRRRNALISAAFAYAQSVLGILAGFWITRLLVRILGTDQYGAWLATGGLIAYAGMTDLGIFAVMPWLFAEADGERNLTRTRSLILHGLLAGAAAGLAYLVAAFALWRLLPHVAHLDSSEIGRLRGPLAVMILATAIASPLQLFMTFLSGRQDFKFLGTWQLGGIFLNAALTYILLRAGVGLYAVAIASVAPTVLVGLAALARSWARYGESMRSLPRPTWRAARTILSSGSSSWMGRLGWQLASATDALVIAHLGYTRLVPSFMITSRLSLTLMQLAWSLPDSALIGLANLGAEGDRARTAEIVRTLMRLTLVPVGAIACITLAANGTFVSAWVGADLYGGAKLNALLTLDVVALSVVHAIVTPAAVLGSRWQVGSSTLANGVVHIIFAIVLGSRFGLAGVAAATTLSALVTTLPIGARVLATRTGISAASTFGSIVLPWAARALPCSVVATLLGWALTQSRFGTGSRIQGLCVAGAAAGLTSMVYMWSVRPMMANLPFGPRLTKILTAVRLLKA